jgi:hypothetical protein
MEQLTDNHKLRFEFREYTEQELQNLQAAILEFKETRLFEFYHWDLQLEIADFQERLVEDDNLDNNQMNAMRGELRAMRRLLTRFSDMFEHLREVEQQKTKPINE